MIHKSNFENSLKNKGNTFNYYRLIIALLFIFAISVPTFAQNKQISLSVQNATLKTVFSQIEKQTPYRFSYREADIDNRANVNIKITDGSIDTVLEKILPAKNLQYSISSNRVMITPAQKKTGESKIRTGQIKDQNGDPIIGANISIKGTTTGTITDIDGNFSIEAAPGMTLLVSYIGYTSKEITINNQSVYQIKMTEDTQNLNEIVVVGYGTQKKANLTGAISQVSGDVLNSRPISNLGQGLQGIIPNLNVKTGSGLPGEGSSYNVRGSTSIEDGRGPLILIDGVQMDPNLISPQDVESVSVLKDAASAAIYGARGGYGVILITTKNGNQNDKATISVSANWGVHQPTSVARTPNSLNWANYINQVAANAGQQPVYNDTYMSYVKAYYNDPQNNPAVFYDPAANDPKHLNDPTAWSYCGNTDWYGETIHSLAFDQRYNISMQGGTNNTKYYVSQSYNNNGGLMKYYNDTYQRWNTNVKVSSQITKWLELTGKVMYNYSDQDLPTPGIWGGWSNLFMNYLSPFMPIKHPDGNVSGQGADTNPAAIQEQGGHGRTKINDAWLTGAVKITPFEGLTINADYTFNYYSKDEDIFVREFYEYRRLPGTEALYPWTTPNSVKNTQKNDYYGAFNIYAQYDKSIAKNNFSIMVGYNNETKSNRGFGVERQKLISNDVPYIGLASGETYTRNDASTGWGIEGAFTRINYNYDNKYYLSFNGRYDGTSKFPSGHRYAFFPSVSAAWRISGEKFMESTHSILDDLKIRLSYGSLGNQSGVGNFSYYPGMGVNTNFGYLMNGAKISKVSVPGLVSNSYTWETINQFDIGFDFSLLNSRLNGSFDWYNRMTLDMLAPSQPYPATLGTSAPKVNSADMKTLGWELSLNWQDRTSSGFSYRVGFVLSDYQAEITKYYNPTGNIDSWYKGKKIGDKWGYTTVGLFESPEDVAGWIDQSKIYGGQWMPGDVKFKDLDGDNQITYGKKTLSDHGDLSVIGNTEPRFNYGITLGGDYKGFDLDLFFQGIGRKDFFPGGNGFWGSVKNYQIPTDWAVENSWTAENPGAYLPRPSMGNSYNQQTQTGYKVNAGYLRLKNLTLGYTIPKALTQKAYISRARIYFSGQNLFCITSLPPIYDPETLDYNKYPVQRTFSVGLDIKF